MNCRLNLQKFYAGGGFLKVDPSQIFLDSQTLFVHTKLMEELHRLFRPVRVMSKSGRTSFGSVKSEEARC